MPEVGGWGGGRRERGGTVGRAPPLGAPPSASGCRARFGCPLLRAATGVWPAASRGGRGDAGPGVGRAARGSVSGSCEPRARLRWTRLPKPRRRWAGAVSIRSRTAVAPVGAIWPRAAGEPSGVTIIVRVTPSADQVRCRWPAGSGPGAVPVGGVVIRQPGSGSIHQLAPSGPPGPRTPSVTPPPRSRPRPPSVRSPPRRRRPSRRGRAGSRGAGPFPRRSSSPTSRDRPQRTWRPSGNIHRPLCIESA